MSESDSFQFLIPEDRWGQLAEAMELPPESWWHLLDDAYAEPHRHYHTMTHIQRGLDVLDRLGADLAVKVAFWFHDFVYDPTAKDNEARSAAIAVDILPAMPLCYGMDLRQEVARLILLTKHHVVEWFDKNGSAMVVADLYDLGADGATYWRNAENIRKEYGMFSDDEWMTGRRKFLEKISAQQIYPPTPEYKSRLDRARRNIENEYADLKVSHD